MVNIKKAKEEDAAVLALLGRLTYAESHGDFIEDINDLLLYLNDSFSVAKTKQELKLTENFFYIIYADDLPVGYAKLVANENHNNEHSPNHCKLERIYILNDFTRLRIGKQLLTFIEEKAKELQLNTMWLSVYIKNSRAIKFYEKNEYKIVDEIDFLVNGTSYKNSVFSKKL